MRAFVSIPIAAAAAEYEMDFDFGVSAPFNGVKISNVELSGRLTAGVPVVGSKFSEVFAALSVSSLIGRSLLPYNIEVMDSTIASGVVYEDQLSLDIAGAGTDYSTSITKEVVVAPKALNIAGGKAKAYIQANDLMSLMSQPYQVVMIVDYELIKLKDTELLRLLQLEKL